MVIVALGKTIKEVGGRVLGINLLHFVVHVLEFFVLFKDEIRPLILHILHLSLL